MKLIFALAVAMFATSAHAFTCDEVKVWHALGFTEETAVKFGHTVTPAERAQAAKCLAAPAQKAAAAPAKKTATKKPAKVAAKVPTPAPAPLPKCYIVGDSIALGTATAEGLPAKYKPDCEVDAKIGIPSSAIIERAHDAQLVVISAGSNDPTNPELVKNLEAIRVVATQNVLWIIPAVSPVAAAAVKKVAADHGDDTIAFTPGPDHTHPHTYLPIITRVNADMGAALEKVNQPVVEQAPPQEVPMSASWLVPVFAVFGALAFTYAVGKYGVVPVFSKVTSWWNSGKADLQALEQRVKNLEAKVAPVVHPSGATGAAV
jgi:hypothetical protein